MNHFTSPVLGIFKIESLEIFDCAGFKPQSSLYSWISRITGVSPGTGPTLWIRETIYVYISKCTGNMFD
jgi:hypothetical protein